MSEEFFKQRKSVSRGDTPEQPPASPPFQNIQRMQEAVARETNSPSMPNMSDSGMKLSGTIPPELLKAIEEKRIGQMPSHQADPKATAPIPDRNLPDDDSPISDFADAFPTEVRQAPKPRQQAQVVRPTITESDALAALLRQLTEKNHWEPFHFPSKGKFYTNIPETVHIRAMTGHEEQILATPRFVKRGMAIDKIFEECIQEKIDPTQLLAIDRTHLLIYLRGISYTPEYDVEIKCPECSAKTPQVIDLNSLMVDVCPDNFDSSSLEGNLPVSGFYYRYRLATGNDDLEVSRYREARLEQYGDRGQDDSLLYRTALLLEEIQGVTAKKELAHLLKKLPISDVGLLRQKINEPPFGVNTEVDIECPHCNERFKIELPLEANFFFPRKRETETPA